MISRERAKLNDVLTTTLQVLCGVLYNQMEKIPYTLSWIESVFEYYNNILCPNICRSYPNIVEPLQNGFVEGGFQEKVRACG